MNAVDAVDEIIAQLRGEQRTHEQEVARIERDIVSLRRAREFIAARVPKDESPESRQFLPIESVDLMTGQPKRTRHTKIEKDVVAALQETAVPMTPHQLRQATGFSISTEKMVGFLKRAVNRGVLVRTAGRYALPGEPT